MVVACMNGYDTYKARKQVSGEERKGGLSVHPSFSPHACLHACFGLKHFSLRASDVGKSSRQLLTCSSGAVSCSELTARHAGSIKNPVNHALSQKHVNSCKAISASC